MNSNSGPLQLLLQCCKVKNPSGCVAVLQGSRADMVSWLRPRSFPLQSVQEPTCALPATSKLSSSLEISSSHRKSMTAAISQLLAQFGTYFFPHPFYIFFLAPLFTSLLRSFQTFPTLRKFAIPLRMQIQIQSRFLHSFPYPTHPSSNELQELEEAGTSTMQPWCEQWKALTGCKQCSSYPWRKSMKEKSLPSVVILRGSWTHAHPGYNFFP